jgi:hypothetical protein
VRRGLAGLFFFVAAILLAIAAGGWWLQRVAFSPSASRAVAGEIFDIDSIQDQVVTLVSTATADRLGRVAPDIEQELVRNLPAMLADPGARDVLADIVSDAHARVIGVREEPVTITGQQMVLLVRNQVVFDVPDVTIPVEKVGFLSTIRAALSWLVPISAIAGLAALVLGVLAHPRKADAIFGIGVFCILAAVLGMVLGYAVPAFALPALNDGDWVDVIPAVANDELTVVAGLSVVLAVVGVMLVFGSIGFRRKQKGWSSPVRVNRYRGEQRRWS